MPDDTDEPREDAIQLAYRQVCSSYADITEFRGKLLALLPLATGAGVFLLLDEGKKSTPLGAIGMFGVAVTLGLFLYELRGIQRCHRLEDQAKQIEKWLGLGVDKGPFVGQPERSLWGIVGPPGAGLFVYLAVVFAWLYVAGIGYEWWEGHEGRFPEWGLGLGYAVTIIVGWVAICLLWPRTWRPFWSETSDEVSVVEFEETKAQELDEQKFTGIGERRDLLEMRHGDMRIAWIRFQDGATTNLHRHDGDQLLFILSGRGWIGTDSAAMPMHARDLVRVPGGVRHWHGAQSGVNLIHLVITRGTQTEWHERPRPAAQHEGAG